MLVLARRVNEKIVINGEVFITILEAGRGGQVRLGFEAPARYQIYRHEILLEIQAENRDALNSASQADAAKAITPMLKAGEPPVLTIPPVLTAPPKPPKPPTPPASSKT